MLFHQGKLEKMTLVAFRPHGGSCSERPELSDASEDSYTVQVNPNSTSLDQLQRYTDRRVPGSSGGGGAFSGTAPATLQLEFLFDGTGAIPPSAEHADVPLAGAVTSALPGRGTFEVSEELAKFKRVACDFRGDIHAPPKLLLIWGKAAFPCVVESLEIRYTLFRPDASPLRAIVTCRFQEWVSDAERVRRENLTSPDLTHLREIREGDTLPLLAHRIYGDASLYLEVARVNKLVDFRRLRAGSKLRLPPLAKGGGR